MIDLPVFDPMDDLNQLLADGMQWIGGAQICLNAPENRPDDYAYGCGTMRREAFDEEGSGPEFRDILESDFTVLCNQFKGTVFEDIYNMLDDRYTLGRVRMINLPPQYTMWWHIDYGYRLHLPIKTQPGAFMVVDDEVRWLHGNQWWNVDVRPPHTAVNSSRENRIHIVVQILDEAFDAASPWETWIPGENRGVSTDPRVVGHKNT